MKHIYLTLLGLMISLSMAAQTEINRTYQPGTLGKTTREQAMKNMRSTGAEEIYSDEGQVIYDGKFVIKGYTMLQCDLLFNKDKLIAIFYSDSLVGSHPDAYNQWATQIKNEYAKIGEDGMEDPVNNLILQSLDLEDQSMQVWSRSDDKTILDLVKKEDACGIMLIDKSSILGDLLSEQELDEYAPSMVASFDEANAVTGVAGCKFGDSRQNVAAKFATKAEKLIDQDSYSLSYSGVSFGDMYFKRGELYFADGRFVACKFDSEFFTSRYEEAKAMYESICSRYDRKYTNGMDFNDGADKVRFYGMVQADYENGAALPIMVTLTKSVSKGGNMYYYVTLSYFIARKDNFYLDEI